MYKTLVLFALCIVIHNARVAAHFNLKHPAPYNPQACNPPNCPGPCPAIWKTGGARVRNTPSTPSAVWRRGESVTVQWHRNNHDGGMYRRSFVPVEHMHDRDWHDSMAFDWGCWSQGRFSCPATGIFKPCGTDKGKEAYHNSFEVPAVLPDGDYVFSMVWFGGVHFELEKAGFDDYYTCAFVTIQGGDFAESYTPTFTPGQDRMNGKDGTCLTTSTFPRECGGTKCEDRKPFRTVAKPFEGGKSPAPLRRSTVESAVEAARKNTTQASGNFVLRYTDTGGPVPIDVPFHSEE